MQTALRASAFAFVSLIALAACAPETAPVAEVETPAAPAIAAFTASADVTPFKIGAFEAAALRDGGGEFPNDNKTIAVNKTKAEVDAVLTANNLPTDQLSLSIQPLIVRTTDKVLLFDTGAAATMGDFGGKLPATMAAAGIDPASVTDIFISHDHGDHVGGLVNAEGALAFPNAAVHMSAPQWDAMQKNPQLAPIVAAVTPKIAAFAPGADLVPGVKAIDIVGHTPGHSGYLITSGDATLAFLGDMAHHSVISVQRPDWTIAFDGDAPTAQASRKKFLEEWAASGQRIFAPHFPFPGIGKVEKQGDNIVWVAEQ
jgi:glyoxylase-like metal-dependent hydrolase (beta-lactamase superfamily II)